MRSELEDELLEELIDAILGKGAWKATRPETPHPVTPVRRPDAPRFLH